VAALSWKNSLFIDGCWVEGTAPEALKVINPANEDVIASMPLGSTEDTRMAVAAARRAFDEGPWPEMDPKERSRFLIRFGERIAERLPELIELNIAEAGSTRQVAETGQTRSPLKQFMWWAERAATYPFVEPLLPVTEGILGQGILRKEPVGVVAGLTAFNFPVLLNLWKIGPALAMGNTLVLKPSPYTPLEATFLADVAAEVGFPSGVLNVVTGDVTTSQELTEHPAVDMVTFTGSDAVGAAIMEQAAPTLKKVLLELGGKSPNIVFADADIEAVASYAALAYIRHAGQGCGNPTRVLVEQSVHDELVSRMVDVLAGVPVGDPSDPGTVMGPLIREQQRARTERYVAEGLAAGAEVAFGGRRPPNLKRGFFFDPTLLVGVDNKMSVAQDEIFGPVAVVIPFSDDDDAVRIANDSRYGLCAYIWSGDPTRAYAVAKRLRVGMVNVNGGIGGLNPTGTFGGYKRSGIGRELSDHGLEEYVELKAVHWPVGR
jgi:aldehyde dehydrogenase (NAD+)